MCIYVEFIFSDIVERREKGSGSGSGSRRELTPSTNNIHKQLQVIT